MICPDLYTSFYSLFKYSNRFADSNVLQVLQILPVLTIAFVS